MRRKLCVLSLVVLGTTSVYGADRIDKSTLLSVDLAKSTFTDVTANETTGLLATNRFTIRRNETTTIEVDGLGTRVALEPTTDTQGLHTKTWVVIPTGI